SVTMAQTGLGNSFSPAHSGGDSRCLARYAPIYGEMGGFGLMIRGPPSTWTMLPYMAYGNYTHSADFKKWNFTIRPGIMFQNGEELDARDVVYTLRYSMTPAWSSATGWYIREMLGSNTSVYWAGEEGTPGAGEPLNYYKVHFSLPDTWAYFLSKIGGASIMPASVIVNSSSGIPDYADWHPDLANTANFQYTSFSTGDGSTYKYYGKNGSLLIGSGPFGAGPYRFVNYDSGTNTIHLTKFMGYFNRAALEDAGKYKIVDYYVKLVTNVNDAIHDLSTGSVQILDSGYGFQDYVGHQINSSFCKWVVYDGFTVQELGFNMQHPIFGTGLGTPVGMANASRAAEAAKHMRRGIEYLFLKDTILKNMTHGYGTYGVATSVPRATWFFNNQIVLRNDTVLNQRLLAIKEFEAAGYHFYVDLTRTGINATTPSWCFGQYGFLIRTSGADNVSVIFFALAPSGIGTPPPGKLPLVYLDIHGVRLEGSNEIILYVYYNVTLCVQLGIDENSLALYIWNSTATSWSALPSTHLSLNSTHGLVFAVAPHISYFAVFGTLPRGGGIGYIEIIAIGAVVVVGVVAAVIFLRRRGARGGKGGTT
nr:ABC transporter substrate-binding protein [Candidatus Njordarchaeum guaymaensis]